jgi:hypothetical protein
MQEFQQEQWLFALPLWPRYMLTVLGSLGGVTGGLRFASAVTNDLAGLTHAADELPGWSFLEQDVQRVLPGAVLIDSWYPQSDYECHPCAAAPPYAPRETLLD